MGLGTCPTRWVWGMACMDDVFAMVDEMRPVVLVVDSIQTMYMNDVSGSAGAPSQVNEWVRGASTAGDNLSKHAGFGQTRNK